MSSSSPQSFESFCVQHEAMIRSKPLDELVKLVLEIEFKRLVAEIQAAELSNKQKQLMDEGNNLFMYKYNCEGERQRVEFANEALYHVALEKSLQTICNADLIACVNRDNARIGRNTIKYSTIKLPTHEEIPKMDEYNEIARLEIGACKSLGLKGLIGRFNTCTNNLNTAQLNANTAIKEARRLNARAVNSFTCNVYSFIHSLVMSIHSFIHL